MAIDEIAETKIDLERSCRVAARPVGREPVACRSDVRVVRVVDYERVMHDVACGRLGRHGEHRQGFERRRRLAGDVCQAQALT
jgi:hypothetical protein